MVASILKTINSVNNANYLFYKFLKALFDDLTLRVMCFHSSSKAASKYS